MSRRIRRVRAFPATAVTTVLEKEALLLHGTARQLAERIATHRHDIPDDGQAIADWAAHRAALIASRARPVFIQALVERHDAALGDFDEVLSERCRDCRSHVPGLMG